MNQKWDAWAQEGVSTWKNPIRFFSGKKSDLSKSNFQLPPFFLIGTNLFLGFPQEITSISFSQFFPDLASLIWAGRAIANTALIGDLLYFWTKRSKTRKHPSPSNSATFITSLPVPFLLYFLAQHWRGFPILIGNVWLRILPLVVFYQINHGFSKDWQLGKPFAWRFEKKDSLWKFLGTSFRKEPTPKKAPQGLGSFCCKGGQSYPPSLGINETCSKLQIDSTVAQTSQRSSAVVWGINPFWFANGIFMVCYRWSIYTFYNGV